MEGLVISLRFGETPFPSQHTCDGEDLSPALEIIRIHSPYLALTLVDPDAPSGDFTQWILWNIKTDGEELIIPEGIPKKGEVRSPIHAIQGKNDQGIVGYSGPCPPRGEMHVYFFNVYGLDGPLNLAPGSDRKALEEAMKGHVLQYGGQAVAPYGR